MLEALRVLELVEELVVLGGVDSGEVVGVGAGLEGEGNP